MLVRKEVRKEVRKKVRKESGGCLGWHSRHESSRPTGRQAIFVFLKYL
jgi:hypothetical protein